MLIDRLRKMSSQGIGVDTETYLLRAGNLVPPLVLGSVAWWDGQKVEGALLTKDQVVELFAQLAEDVNKIIVGANFAFDLAVLVKEFAKRGIDLLPYIFKLLMGEHTDHMTGIHDGRVFDIQHAQTLNAIATGMLGKNPRNGIPYGKGRYSQERVVWELFDDEGAKKNDMYRLRYGEFDGWPLDQLPPEAQQYPVDDTVYALKCALAQCGVLPKVNQHHKFGKNGICTICGAEGMDRLCWTTAMHHNLHDLAAQTASAFCAHMGAAHGFRIDQKYVDLIEEHANKSYDENAGPFKEMGLIRKDGSEDRSLLKKKIAIAHGSKMPCPTCAGTGKVTSLANAKSKVICFRLDEFGEKQKTCDGTGLVLTEDVPLSEKGGIAYGRSNLVESGDEDLMEYADLQEDQKIRTVYVKFLRRGRACISCGNLANDPESNKAEERHAEGCAMAGWKDIPLTLSPNPILDTKRMSFDGAVMLLPRATGKLVENVELVEVPDDYVLQPGEEWA